MSCTKCEGKWRGICSEDLGYGHHYKYKAQFAPMIITLNAMNKILVLHGPNLNLLGIRESVFYGKQTLSEINQLLIETAEHAGMELSCHQSNSESELIHFIHQAGVDNIQYIIFNPAAYTHTSIALRDALLAVTIPFIEVHLSNIHARESFRHNSFFSDIATGTICGLGAYGYLLALKAIIKALEQRD